jgi:hypothetical protein
MFEGTGEGTAGAIRPRGGRVAWAGAVAGLALGGWTDASGAGDPVSPAPVAELAPQRGRMESRFAKAVAVSGTQVLVGSPFDEDGETADGSVHAFGDSRRGWRRVQRFQWTDPKSQDRFGAAIAVGSGRLAVARDRSDEAGVDAGAVAVFRKVGAHWRFEADLLASDGADADGFGASLAVSGDFVAVGTPHDDRDGIHDAGTVSIFTVREGEWRRETLLGAANPTASEWFGNAVAMSGPLLAIGAYGDDARGMNAGAVHVWRRGSEGWKAEVRLEAEDGAAGDWFGFALDLHDDRLAIGAPRDDRSGESAGCVRIYRRVRGTWSLEETLRPAAGADTAWFGYAIDLTEDRIAIGMPGDDEGGTAAGSVRVYRRGADGWREEFILRPPKPREWLQFGASVGLGGDLAVVGMLRDEDGPAVPGSAWVFRLGGRGASGETEAGPPARQKDPTPTTTGADAAARPARSRSPGRRAGWPFLRGPFTS